MITTFDNFKHFSVIKPTLFIKGDAVLLLRNTGMRWSNSFLKHKDNRKNKLGSSLINLEKSNPVVILKKGFSIAFDEDTGKAIKSIRDTGIEKIMRLLLKDGTLKSKVIEVDNKIPEIGKKSENR